jgi:SAM-dependent methyltransferase
MSGPSSDKQFIGAIPELYDTYFVPLIFDQYAEDLVARLATRAPRNVLELAAGTGVVTRRLAASLARDATIVASDLNQPMLDHAARVGTARPVEWRQADAMQLPFTDASFDAVVCQFGVMFFPEKRRAFAEARRVLKPGGVFCFNVWGRIENNEWSAITTDALAEMFPQDPPRFIPRVPHGYHDREVVIGDLEAAGFTQPEFVTVTKRSHATSARIPAVALCQGSPLRNEIEARDPTGLEEATRRVEAAIAKRFGPGAVECKIEAHVVTAVR